MRVPDLGLIFGRLAEAPAPSPEPSEDRDSFETTLKSLPTPRSPSRRKDETSAASAREDTPAGEPDADPKAEAAQDASDPDTPATTAEDANPGADTAEAGGDPGEDDAIDRLIDPMASLLLDLRMPLPAAAATDAAGIVTQATVAIMAAAGAVSGAGQGRTGLPGATAGEGAAAAPVPAEGAAPAAVVAPGTPAPAGADAVPVLAHEAAAANDDPAVEREGAPAQRASRHADAPVPADDPAPPATTPPAPGAAAPAVATAQASATFLLDPAAAPSWQLQSADTSSLSAAPATTPAPAPFTHASPQAVASQIAVGVSGGSGSGGGDTVEIRLDPPELGKVQIRLEHHESGLKVTVMAERPDTQDFLRRHAAELSRELSGTGQNGVVLDFASGQGTGRFSDGQATGWAVLAEPETAASGGVPATGTPPLSALSLASAPRSGVSGSLDIRL